MTLSSIFCVMNALGGRFSASRSDVPSHPISISGLCWSVIHVSVAVHCSSGEKSVMKLACRLMYSSFCKRSRWSSSRLVMRLPPKSMYARVSGRVASPIIMLVRLLVAISR